MGVEGERPQKPAGDIQEQVDDGVAARWRDPLPQAWKSPLDPFEQPPPFPIERVQGSAEHQRDPASQQPSLQSQDARRPGGGSRDHGSVTRVLTARTALSIIIRTQSNRKRRLHPPGS